VGVIAFVVLVFLGVGQGRGLVLLSDAALVPAVCLLAVGGFLSLRKSGAFDIFSYAFSRLILIVAPPPRSELGYYEYKESRPRREVCPLHFYLSGAVFLLLSLFLALLFVFIPLN
jgi:hypothetical protein